MKEVRDMMRGINIPGGQSIADRLTAAKHSIAGSGLAKVVCKATTEEVTGPKKKHLDYLLQCTNEMNVSIPQMGDLLIERTQHASWVVTFKALITIHHLMCYGNERFSQYMASNPHHFALTNFVDKTGVQGLDMSAFIRKYATYLNEKRNSYKVMAFDFCKVKRGKDDGMLRKMATEKLLKTLPVLQQQLDALLEFDATPNELTNGVINCCFILLFKDLVRLFACYNDGIINLLEKYFEMNKKQCREGLDLYKKFLVRMDKVQEFLKVAENVGIDKESIPDLVKAPSSLLEALEAHLGALEGKKGAPGASKPSTSTTGAAVVASFVQADDEKNQALREEEETLRALKERHLQKQASLKSPSDGAFSTNNPFGDGASSGHATDAGLDPFGDLSLANPAPNVGTAKSNNDLMFLSGNPFADALMGNNLSQPAQRPAAAPATSMNPFTWNGTAAQPSNGAFTADFSRAFQQGQQQVQPNEGAVGGDAYAAESQGSSVFASATGGGSGSAGTSSDPFLDLFGDVGLTSSAEPRTLTPSPVPQRMSPSPVMGFSAMAPASPAHGRVTPTAGIFAGGGGGGDGEGQAMPETSAQLQGFDAFGEILQPQSSGHQATSPAAMNMGRAPQQPAQKMSGDLDSTLAQLATSLDIRPTPQKKDHQWNPGAGMNQQKTGGANWKPAQPGAPGWQGAPAQPGPGMGAPFPGAMPGGMRPMGMMGAQSPMSGMPMMGQPRAMNQQPQQPANDPFGSL